MALSALALVHTITGTSRLPAPALQRGNVDAKQQRQLMCKSTLGHTFIQDLQRLLAIDRRGQSSPISPQKA
jgi:hypothetical protein